MLATGHQARLGIALAEYREARRQPADSEWAALLVALTASESLWRKARPFLDLADVGAPAWTSCARR